MVIFIKLDLYQVASNYPPNKLMVEKLKCDLVAGFIRRKDHHMQLRVLQAVPKDFLCYNDQTKVSRNIYRGA